MRPDWEPLALSQSPVESAGSACMTLPPGYILFWGLENTKEYIHIRLKITFFKMYSTMLNVCCWINLRRTVFPIHFEGGWGVQAAVGTTRCSDQSHSPVIRPADQQNCSSSSLQLAPSFCYVAVMKACTSDKLPHMNGSNVGLNTRLAEQRHVRVCLKGGMNE